MNIGAEAEKKTIFAGFSDKDINIAWQMILFLRKVGVSIEEFEKYADYRQKEASNSILVTRANLYLRTLFFDKHSEKCPECGGSMKIEPVNISKCTMVPNKKLNSVWSCKDLPGCGYQKWNRKPSTYYISKIEKKFHEKYKDLTYEEIIKIDVPKDFYKLNPSLESTFSNNKKSGGCREK